MFKKFWDGLNATKQHGTTRRKRTGGPKKSEIAQTQPVRSAFLASMTTRRRIRVVAAGVAGMSLFLLVPPPASAAEIKQAPYDDGWDGCAGFAGPVDPSVRPTAPAQTQALRVMAYNINSGERLSEVTATIYDVKPDIVLLNEVVCDYWAGTPESRQARHLARAASLPYYAYEDTADLGWANPFHKTKGVAILSRFPILQTQLHMVEYSGEAPNKNFGTLQATIQIGNVTHEVFSTRHAPINDDYNSSAVNEAGHQQDLRRVRRVPLSSAVIYGGDLNANWATRPWSAEFRDKSGLFHTLVQDPDEMACYDNANRIDYIYYRGPYALSDAVERVGMPSASDHCYVRADFTPKADALVGISIEGPGEVEPGQDYTLRAVPYGTGDVIYAWSTGETGSSITRRATTLRGSRTHQVTVTARNEKNKYLSEWRTVTWGTAFCWKCYE